MGAMARHRFAGDLTSITMGVGPDGYVQLLPTVVRFYDAQYGGNEIDDLTWDKAGVNPAQIPILSAALSDENYVVGEIGTFYGPDGVWAMWVGGEDGPRLMIVANDLPDYIRAAQAAADKAQADATKALSYPLKFTQAAPAATWTFTHGLKTKPSVNVVDASGQQLMTEVHYPDDDTVTLMFASPATGTVYVHG